MDPLTLPRPNPSAHILALTRTSTHALLSALFALPPLPASLSSSSTTGPVVLLNGGGAAGAGGVKTLLPRAKPLPRPKEPTKWERFAKAKGISHAVRDKAVWDEERGEWVGRWGKGGKNKEGEEDWAVEVKAGAGEWFCPGV